ncbi:MAG: DUF4153 domain-containing protein [Alistipes sp.]|nr:DUF4153 domain-containing protein [Alistipes sp.]
MKFDLKQYFGIIREGMMRIVRNYSVELVLAVYAAVVWLTAYEADWSQGYCRAAVVPLFFALSLAVNRLAGRGPWRRVYWVSWMPLIPLSVWGGLEDWVGETQYVVSLCVLAPLALLLCRRAVCNGRFMSDAIVWLRSFVLAELFANVALGLFAAILFSTTYIFGFHGSWIEHVWMYGLIFCESLVAPSLFLLMADRWRDAEIRGNRILEVLLDYIVTPALLIYTAVLYLYTAKILVTWSLPEGGVAYMVFGFTIMALAVKALQFVLEKRRYDWFFDRFSLISLPLLVLFWVGTVHRTNEYGFTEPRVWLVACGGLMTFCVLLFLSRRSGRYWWVCAAGFAIFALMAYVPALRPERIAVRSQLGRAMEVASRLELLDDDGTLRLDRFGADTTFKADYRRFYESVQYIAWRDTAAFRRLGADMDAIRAAVPQPIRDYVVYGWADAVVTEAVTVTEDIYLMQTSRRVSCEGYSTLYPDWDTFWQDDAAGDYSYCFRNDTLILRFDGRHPDRSIAVSDLLSAQLRRAGIVGIPSGKKLIDSADDLLVYSDDELLVVFQKMSFERSDSTLRISDLTVDVVMTR